MLVGLNATVVGELDAEGLGQARRLALGQNDEARCGLLAPLEFEIEARVTDASRREVIEALPRLFDRLDASIEQLSAEARGLLARDLLEVRAMDFFDPEVVLELSPVHGGLVLSVDAHRATTLCQKQGCAQPTRTVAHDSIIESPVLPVSPDHRRPRRAARRVRRYRVRTVLTSAGPEA